MKWIDKIKTMDINELAKFLTELQCEECGYKGMNFDDYNECDCVGCWCHPNNGYESYKKYLDCEVSNEVHSKL